MRKLDPSNPWPAGLGGLVELPGAFRDSRGAIQNLTEFPSGSVAIITSNRGTVRSDHWHKTDAHYLFCLAGSFRYFECAPLESLDEATPLYVGANQMVYTPPSRAHRCEFDCYTVIVSISKLVRTHENHEADVVRL